MPASCSDTGSFVSSGNHRYPLAHALFLDGRKGSLQLDHMALHGDFFYTLALTQHSIAGHDSFRNARPSNIRTPLQWSFTPNSCHSLVVLISHRTRRRETLQQYFTRPVRCGTYQSNPICQCFKPRYGKTHQSNLNWNYRQQSAIHLAWIPSSQRSNSKTPSPETFPLFHWSHVSQKLNRFPLDEERRTGRYLPPVSQSLFALASILLKMRIWSCKVQLGTVRSHAIILHVQGDISSRLLSTARGNDTPQCSIPEGGDCTIITCKLLTFRKDALSSGSDLYLPFRLHVND